MLLLNRFGLALPGRFTKPRTRSRVPLFVAEPSFGSTISLLPSTGELHISMSNSYRVPPVFAQDLILQEYAPKNGLAKSFPTYQLTTLLLGGRVIVQQCSVAVVGLVVPCVMSCLTVFPTFFGNNRLPRRRRSPLPSVRPWAA